MITMDEALHKIEKFTDKAHGEQLRKYSGERYIVHPVRVMEICKQYTEDITILAAALLHDVLEDTPVTKAEIYDFLKHVMNEALAAETVKLVVDLTDVYIKENFPQHNRKMRKLKELERLSNIHKKAQTVKYADIIDNSQDITENDADFAPVYLKEMHQLLLKMDKGNPDLYKRALTTVEECRRKLNR